MQAFRPAGHLDVELRHGRRHDQLQPVVLGVRDARLVILGGVEARAADGEELGSKNQMILEILSPQNGEKQLTI
jgi:hypothetical protein